MKKRVLAAVLALTMMSSSMAGLGSVLSVSAATPFDGEAWFDQIDTVQINREAPHATSIPYQDVATALKNEQSAITKDASVSSYYQLLSSDTAWNFKFAEKPADRLVDPDTEDLGSATGWNTDSWDTIPVPSSWQTIKDDKGIPKYEMPIYTNQTYPWANYERVELGANVKAPTVKNGVGQYQRTFTLAEGWENRNTYISFQGVESAFYLWVDGKRVGYAEDSYTADDFNITPYLNPDVEEHTLSVQVYRWSTGSYLENQDFIRMSGIFRDVFLYSKNDVELRDYFVTTDFDDKYENATLNLEADIRNISAETPGAASVEATLYDMQDTAIWDAPMVIAADMTDKAKGESLVVNGSKDVTAPKKWFADDPNLYKLLIQVKDANGDVLETVCQRVGFRELGKVDINEKGQEQMQINGKKITFRGTNRHETDDVDGRALKKEDIITDLKTMKQFNINAIRTSHYPEHTLTYELADEFGLYICDEANIESHSGATQSDIPSGFPIWKTSALDRTINMVERDKNHPSVVIWSLGNEATYKIYSMNDAYCMYQNTLWILDRDPSRMRKYERDNRYTKGNREASMVDIHSVQYPSVDWTAGAVKSITAPFIWSEYAHSMGNALGNFDEYWEIVRENKNAQGGFIWDWMDQSVSMPIQNFNQYYATDAKTNSKATINGTLVEGINGTKALKGDIFVPVKESHKANSAAITLESWVNPSALTGQHNTILSKGDDGYTLKLNVKDSKVEFFVDGYTKGTAMAAFPTDITDGTFKHIVGVAANGKLKIYYNGAVIAETATTAKDPLDTNGRGIAVGNASDMTDRKFNGTIDSVGVYNRALTAEEIASAYQAKTLSAVADENVVYKMTFNDSEVIKEGTNYEEGNYFAYGGDWGENTTDRDFCGNGVMFADRTPKPALYQVKKTHQEVSFYDDGQAKDGIVRIENEFIDTNLNQYNFTWKLKEDNTVLKEGTLNLDVAPEGNTTTALDFGNFVAKEGYVYTLDFSVTQKEKAAWADNANHEIAFEQLKLDYAPEVERPLIDASDMPEVTVDDTTEAINLSNDQFSMSFDKTTGAISSYSVNGEQVIKQGPTPSFFRAGTSNDGLNSWDAFKGAGDKMIVKPEDIIVENNGKTVNVMITGTLPTMNNSKQSISYTIFGNGEIAVENIFAPNGGVGSLPKVGMNMTIAKGYENLQYYGRGPIENYVDRKSSQRIGVYNSTVKEQFEEKYIRPQDNASRSDVLWTSLVNDDGNGIMVSSLTPMYTTALHYKAEDFNPGGFMHPYQVKKQDDTILSIDVAQRGLGNASCGPGPLGEYTLSGNEVYKQSFRISPVTSSTDKMENSKLRTDNVYPIKDILINGKSVDGFGFNILNYTDTRLVGSTEVPVISVVKNDPNSTVEITQPSGVPGVATVKATSSSGLVRTYTINFDIVSTMYASDMPWTVNVGGYSPNMRDTCTCGSQMGVYVGGAKTPFAKGVGVHANSTVKIDIQGMGLTNFQALAGAGMERTATTSVIFTVEVDGVEKYNSGIVRAKENARPVDVDVRGAKTVTLKVDTTSDGDGSDHANWADAKFVIVPPTVEDIAADLVIDTPPAVGDTQIKMPTVPTGFEVAITGSSNENVIKLDGTIVPPAVETSVDLTFTVSKAGARSGETATKVLTVVVPAKEKPPIEGDVNKKILNFVIDYADSKMDEVETLVPSAKVKFMAAYDNAVAVKNKSDATQIEVDQAWVLLMDAIHMLSFQAGDKTELIALITVCKGLNLDNFQDTAAFEAALAAAIAVRDDENALASDIKPAYDNLNAALKALVLKDKYTLTSAVNYAEGLKQDLLVDNAAKAAIFGTDGLLAAAKAVLDNPKSTQAQIDAAAEALFAQIAELRYKADKATLEAVIKASANVDENEFTPASFSAYKEAIKAGEAVLADPNATDKQIAQAVADIEAAQKALIKTEVPPTNGGTNDTDSKQDVTADGANGTTNSATTGDTNAVAALAALMILSGAVIVYNRKKRN